MGRRLGLLVLTVLLGLGTTACSVRMGDLTVASPRLVNLDSIDLDTLPTNRRVEGEDKVWVILFIPLGLPRLDEAIENALDRGGGDVMTDISIHREAWWFFIGKSGFKVVGDVVDTRQRSGIQS